VEVGGCRGGAGWGEGGRGRCVGCVEGGDG
jgi:hypothetical protein